MKWISHERAKVDRMARPWLIMRFAASDARFGSLANDADWSLITDGILHDVPGCELAHHPQDVSFDSILNKHSLNDPARRLLAEMVRAADQGIHTHLAKGCPGSPTALAASPQAMASF